MTRKLANWEATEKVFIEKTKASSMKSRKLSFFSCIIVVIILGGVSDDFKTTIS